ncbi:MAG: hypothetical protein JO000_10785 [Alphaproteobacteria bacterium]|nr:hypothetical protein [Alphaproteobacteria bacterium]
MKATRTLVWALAILLAAAAVALAHGLLALVNPLLGMPFVDLLVASAFLVALVHALIIGVPIALVYRACGWRNLIAVAVGGLLIGVLPYALFALLMLSPVALTDFKLIALFGGYGALGALVFWLTLRRLDPI